MFGADVVVTATSGDLLCGHNHRSGAGGEPHEQAFPRPSLALDVDETLLGRLLAHADGGSDLRPRGTPFAGVVDEVAHEVVGHGGESIREHHCFGELVQWLRSALLSLYEFDQVLQLDGIGAHSSTLG